MLRIAFGLNIERPFKKREKWQGQRLLGEQGAPKRGLEGKVNGTHPPAPAGATTRPRGYSLLSVGPARMLQGSKKSLPGNGRAGKGTRSISDSFGKRRVH